VFGKPVHLSGDHYDELAGRVEIAVRNLD